MGGGNALRTCGRRSSAQTIPLKDAVAGDGKRPPLLPKQSPKIDVEDTMMALARCRATKSQCEVWNLKPRSVTFPLARDVWQKR